MAENADLGDFGGGANPDPPVVRKRQSIHISVGGTPKHVGHLAVPTDESGLSGLVYVTTRDSHDHRLRYLREDEGGAYAVSNHAIGEVSREAHRLGSTGPQTFLVHEVDTGDVYEWAFDALARGPQVPESFIESASDPQRFVTRDAARHVWDDHGDRLYRARGGEWA